MALTKLHMYSLSIKGGLKLSLFSLYGQSFLRYLPIFKITIFGYETWPLAKVTEVLHILFPPQGVEIEIVDLWAAVSEIQDNIQNGHIWAWKIAIFGQNSRSCTYTLFLPKGVEIEFIFAYSQGFLRYGPTFKMPMFGHETWPLAKGPEVVHIPSFYLRG